MSDYQQFNEIQDSHTFKTFCATALIVAAAIVIIVAITKTPDPAESKKKENETVFVDPNTVTKEDKEQGFTTERIYKHFQDFIELYFPDNKEAFEGWTVQYKKNEEWNNVTWTTLDGSETSGHYEGICDYATKTIYLNDDYFPRYDSHDDVLLHEMIHVLYPLAGHQNEFMDECTRLGKISPFTKAKIYGYDGWGSVD